MQHAAEPLGQLVVGGHAVGDAGGLHLALGPHEPLVHGRLGGEEGPGDLGHLEAADGPEGEGHPGLEGEGGVAAREEQAEPVVGDAAAVVAVLVGRRGVVLVAHECFEVLEGGLVGGAGAAAAEGVDRPPPGDGGQPAAGPRRARRASATPPRPRRRRRRRLPRRGRRRRPPGRRASRGARSTPRGTPARWPGAQRCRPQGPPTAQASCSWTGQGSDLDGAVGHVRHPLGPAEGGVEVGDVDDDVAEERLLRLGERAVGHERLVVADADGGGGRLGVEAVGGDQRAGPAELAHELAPLRHLGVELGGALGRAGVGSVAEQQHVLHSGPPQALGVRPRRRTS